MGFLQDLLGGTQADAFDQSRGVAQNSFNVNEPTLNKSFDSARGNIGEGFAGALNSLSGAGNAVRQGGATARGDIDQGLSDAGGFFNQGRGSLVNAGGQFSGLEDIAQSFSPARQTLIGALGLGGEDASNAARDTFQNSFQPTFEAEQGLDFINRGRAARGAGTNSGGNIDRDTQLFGQSLANSRTNQFLDRLTGLTDREINTTGTAAQGRAGADTGIANSFFGEGNLANQGGVNRANIAQNTAGRIQDIASGQANLQTGRGNALGNLDLQQGQGQIGLQDTLDQNIINSILGGAQAKGQGAQNTARLGTDFVAALANAAATAAGASGGGGGGGTPVPLQKPV